jgi:subtilisin family serine protease
MKKIIYILLLSISFNLYSQTEDAWVYFSDKPDAAYFIANPLEMLSERSIERRIRQGISIDNKDVPVDTSYLTQIETVSGITILAKSKWLNAVHIEGTIEDINALLSLDFVLSIEFANSALNSRIAVENTLTDSHFQKLDIQTDFNYGQATNQIEMLNGDFLHENDFTGTGMQIAVIDAGFTNVNTMGAFNRIYTNNQILGTYNFVENNEEVYSQHYHGTMVLSTLAGYIENEFVGTAPDAKYYLFISEDVNQEHPLEESLWVAAAERADSLGVDVINTSLGYTTFDRSEYNHTYQDMDGKTTFISRGAEIAFSRGMLVINAAGNSGNGTWHYIGAPADAHSILSIGAVNADESMASFSSYGPASDGQIKPDVCAQGGGSTVVNTSNTIINANGTSFASPILTGVATCFWQAFPNKTNSEIAQAIRESAHLFSTPEDHYGHGIPDFEAAYIVLSTEDNHLEDTNIYPNPIEINQVLYIKTPTNKQLNEIIVSDALGRVIYYHHNSDLPHFITIPQVSSGLYSIQLNSDSENISRKLIIK